MLTWEQYDKDTWGAEWGALDRLALVKRLDDGTYACLVGTTTEMEWHTACDTLYDAQAKCQRYMLLVNNCEPKRVLALCDKV